MLLETALPNSNRIPDGTGLVGLAFSFQLLVP
jgi:hypothetical protein